MSVEEPNVPNVHEKVVPDIGEVELVKFTSKGAHPESVLAVNPAVRARALCATKSGINNKRTRRYILIYYTIMISFEDRDGQ